MNPGVCRLSIIIDKPCHSYLQQYKVQSYLDVLESIKALLTGLFWLSRKSLLFPVKRRMRRLKVAAAFAFLLSVAYGKTSPELSVNLSNGSPLTGQYMVAHGGRGILAFKNIPYAEAPVGNLRFADPVPKAPWTQPLPVQTATIMCPQLDNMVHQTGFVGQEDCLYLNVYKPMVRKWL